MNHSTVMLNILRTILLLSVLILGACAVNTSNPEQRHALYSGKAGSPTRVVVIPYYVEDGASTKNYNYAVTHYRRIARFISNQMARHGIEVINPYARDAAEMEYNHMMERSREDSSLAAMEMTRKYETDVAYIVWLTVKKRITSDGLCKVTATLEGEGYDSGARDLGIGIQRTMKYSKRDCDEAIIKAEKEVADLVGRKITAWTGRQQTSRTIKKDYKTNSYSRKPDATVETGGVLQRNTSALSNLINVKLMEVTESAHASIFGRVLNSTRGVIDAKRYRSRLLPENPQGSWVSWRIRIDQTDPFRLQENIMKAVLDVVDSGGTVTIKGMTYRYSAGEVDVLKGIRQLDSTSREIIFIVDRERARDMDFSGRHDPYKAPANRRQNDSRGFD